MVRRGTLCSGRLKGVTYRIIGGDGREYGPSSLDEIRDWIVDGRVAPSTKVWESGDGQWLPAAQRPELRWDLPTPAVPPPVLPTADGAPMPMPAPIPLRVAAFFFDFVVVALAVWLVSLPWEAQLIELHKAAIDSTAPDFAAMLRYWTMGLGFHIPVSLAYHVGFNTAMAATPGKMLVGLRIVREDGTRLDFFRALLRFVVEPLSLGTGYLVALFIPSGQTLHDIVARTIVVRAPST